jgi:hypothetical protein
MIARALYQAFFEQPVKSFEYPEKSRDLLRGTLGH